MKLYEFLYQSIVIKHSSLYEKTQQDKTKDLSRQTIEIHDCKLRNELEWPAMIVWNVFCHTKFEYYLRIIFRVDNRRTQPKYFRFAYKNKTGATIVWSIFGIWFSPNQVLYQIKPIILNFNSGIDCLNNMESKKTANKQHTPKMPS